MKLMLPLLLMITPAMGLQARDEDRRSSPLVGTVESVKSDTLSIVPSDGKPVAIRLSGETRYTSAGKAASRADLKPGARARVTVLRKGETLVAREVSLERASVYTCSMHPEIEQAEPGKCPKCGMFLEEKP